MKVVVLVSGGIDSVTALHHAHRDHQVVGALSFDYGSKHNPRELPQATWHANKLGVPHRTIRLSFINDLFVSDLLRSGGEIPEGHYQEASMKKTVVPFRNGIMLSIAAGYAESCEADALVIATHAGDHAIYPDCREDFMNVMANAVELGTYARIQLLRPFIHWNKAEIVVRGATLGVNFSHTWSCYKGGQRHCGKCGTCVERREAFIRAGVPDPTDYVAQTPLPKAPRTTRRVKVVKNPS